MCKLASFLYRPTEQMEIRVAVLDHHEATRQKLGLPADAGPDCWHDGHYLPTGEIACPGVAGDTLTPAQCEAWVRAQWPTFWDFLRWAFAQPGVCETDGSYGGYLDLSGLTDAKGLVLPKTIGGYLDLSGLTDAKGLVLPKTIGGSLNLSGLTDAKGLVLPKGVKEYRLADGWHTA